MSRVAVPSSPRAHCTRRTMASVTIQAVTNPITAEAVTSLGQWRKANTRERPIPAARTNANTRTGVLREPKIRTPANAKAPTVWPLGKEVEEPGA